MNYATLCCWIGGVVVFAIILLTFFHNPKSSSMKTITTGGTSGYIIEKDGLHRTFSWKGYTIIAGSLEYMHKFMNIPYAGLLIIKDDFAMFKREDIHGPDHLVLEKAKEFVAKKDYNLVIAWKDDYEIACGSEEFLSASYGIKIDGIVVKEDNFLHIFEAKCKGLNRQKMLAFLKKNLNKNEDALAVVLPTGYILHVKAEVAEKMFTLPMDTMYFYIKEESIGYGYNIPFKIRSREEILNLAEMAYRLHTEEYVTLDIGDKFIGIYSSKVVSLAAGDDSMSQPAILTVLEKGGETTQKVVRWRAWTREEILRALEEY